MSSDEEQPSGADISEFETQFVPRSNDDEVLYEVLEITAERGRQYRVRWAGVDPATGKPWPQEWVHKHDCTDELVAEWKAKKAKKERGGVKKHAARTTTKLRASSKSSGSSSSQKKRPPLASRQASNESSDDEHSVHVAAATSKTTSAKRKRRSESTVVGSTGDQQIAEQDEPSRARKKRKTAVEVRLPVDGNDARPSETKEKTSKRKRVLSAERLDSESEVEKAVTPPLKVGPPRGVQRQNRTTKPTKTVPHTPGTTNASPSSSRQQAPDIPGIVPQKSTRAPHHSTTSSPSPPPSKPHRKARTELGAESPAPKDRAPSPQPPLPHAPTPPRSSVHRRSPELSPGARARLELFDLMMAETPEPPAVTRSSPDNADRLDYGFGDVSAQPHSPPPLMPQPSSKPKSTRDVSNGIVPETETSGNSQSQSQSLPQVAFQGDQMVPRDASPHCLLLRTNSNASSGSGSRLPKRPEQHLDLPEIAVISASTSTSISPVEVTAPVEGKKIAQSTRPCSKPVYKPVPQISPETFRSKVKPLQRIARDTEVDAPASSIESFPSPRRDNGKRRAVDNHDSLESSDDDKQIAKLTDSAIKHRGRELFDQIQRTRETQRAKAKTTKRVKNVDDLVKARNLSKPASKRRSRVDTFTSSESHLHVMAQEAEDAFVDLTGADNSTTLDTQEVSSKMPRTEQAMDLLRIQLRQEEEENTQEALEGRLQLDLPKDGVNRNGVGGIEVAQVTTPEEPNLPNQQDDADQPSELQLASVIVQASQGQQPEDIDAEIPPTEHPTSSPARVIPDDISDSPKRRLGEALSLLNVKSEEIQRLEGELAKEREDVRNLQEELTKLRKSAEVARAETEELAAIRASLAEERSLRQTEVVSREAERARWSGDRASWEEERIQWQNDLVLWERRLGDWKEERASLSSRIDALSDVTRKAEEDKAKWELLCGEWEAERADWDLQRETWLLARKSMEKDRAARDQQLAVLEAHRAAYDQDRSNWVADRAQWTADGTRWEDEKAKWEAERTLLMEERDTLSKSVSALTSSVETLTVAKTSAEKDTEFFRGQYAQASGYVSSVRAENSELEKQAKIARGQAEEGVAMIKALFENRVKAFQDDVDRWKALAELLQEKDRKTNDEIRLRAAREPELQERCRQLTSENESLETDLRKLGQAQQRVAIQRNKLYREVIILKQQRAAIKSKLRKATASQETSNSAPAGHPASSPVDPDDIDPNDMDIIPDPSPAIVESNDEAAWFPCMWRPKLRERCQQIFDSKEDLETHLQQHFRHIVL